jgi:hypothetical protein
MLQDRDVRSALRSGAVKVTRLRTPSPEESLAQEIACCAGYTVERAGSWIGTVEQVGYEPSERWDRPSAVTVRLGRASKRLIRVAASEVREVVPSERRVVLTATVDFVSYSG